MKSSAPLAVGILLGLVLSNCVAAGEPPQVTRVEPPGWWLGHSWNPVRVLIEGRELAGARLETPPGITAGELNASANGTWAFADLKVTPQARKGRQQLLLVNRSGTTRFHFELLEPLPSRGRFQGFSPDDVIYLAMTDRFASGDTANDNPASSPGLLDRSKPRHYHGGDLAGVTQRLPYLQQLGVSALWLTPWYDNANQLNQLEKYTTDNQRSREGVPSTDYHGYGAVDFYAVEERFGDLDALKKMVQAAQARGIKVIQDQVANHTGPYHRWTTNSPTPTWYNGTVADHLENTWQTWTIADPNPPADKLKATLDGWFINILPDLNQNDPDSGTYLIQNSLWWLGMTGLDAVRQDTLPYVPRTHWARWTAALKREYPRLTVLGEMWDGNPKLVSFFQGGRRAFDGVDTGVDTLFDFPLCYAIRDVFAKRQPTARLAQTLAADTNYVDARVLVTFLGLHDMPRFLEEKGADLTGLKLAFAFLLTARGTPLIYYGDEIGMRGGGDPDNRRDFPGGFPRDPQNAFASSGRTPEQSEIHGYVSELLRVRRQLEPLRRGDLTVLEASPNLWVCSRTSRGRTAVVAINNGLNSAVYRLSASAAGLGNARILKPTFGTKSKLTLSDGAFQLSVPARLAVIYSD